GNTRHGPQSCRRAGGRQKTRDRARVIGAEAHGIIGIAVIAAGVTGRCIGHRELNTCLFGADAIALLGGSDAMVTGRNPLPHADPPLTVADVGGSGVLTVDPEGNARPVNSRSSDGTR